MGSKGRWEGGHEKQIFLDFAVDLLFLHPWAKDCRELNSLERNPVVPEKPVATHLPEYFCSPLPNQVKKKKNAPDKRPLLVEQVRFAKEEEPL